jgi:hypothetical protein
MKRSEKVFHTFISPNCPALAGVLSAEPPVRTSEGPVLVLASL